MEDKKYLMLAWMVFLGGVRIEVSRYFLRKKCDWCTKNNQSLSEDLLVRKARKLELLQEKWNEQILVLEKKKAQEKLL
ncbi:MAG: hypothetical protein E7397_08565 [Ruminococcaceae bacterium]|nr:hypothetical protein [Oscillospiraceae bacterium]